METSSEFMSVIVCGNEVSVCSVKQGGLSDQSSQIIYVKVLTTQSEEISGANKTGERPPVIVMGSGNIYQSNIQEGILLKV